MTYYPIDKIRSFIIAFEKFSATAYPATESERNRGIWTYGYGFTSKMDGSKVKEGDVISIEMANQQIDREINARRTQIISALGFTPAPQQLDCMTSLAYNSKGVSAFPKLITYLKSGDSRSAALQMLDMIYQKDTKSIPHPVKGLIYRRGSEFDMWMSGDYERLYHLPEHIRSLMIYMNSFNQEATELLLSMEKVK